MATMHEYPVSVNWEGGRNGEGAATAKNSNTKVELRVPPEFQGPGGGTNPEELLTTAICGCYSITFGIIAENRKLPLQRLEVDATGEVEQNGAQFTYKSITVKPTIVLDSSATDEQMTMAEDMAHKADAYCIITNAVRGKVDIQIEPNISRG